MSSFTRIASLTTKTAMTKSPAKSPAILYHYPCPDGVFSALAAHLHFSSAGETAKPLFFPNTVYSPLTLTDLPLSEISDLYLLDFAGPSGFVSDVASHVRRVVILDHHKTAFESLSTSSFAGDNVEPLIDVRRSGATIAFDYFRAKTSDPKTVAKFDRMRRFFEYIEDGDLWQWKLPNSKAFSSGLADSNLEFSFNLNPSLFEQLLGLDLESVISRGIKSLSEKQRLIDSALSRSYEIALGGGRFGNCLAVDADSISNLRSELGNQLAIKSHSLGLRGIGAVVYKVPELENEKLLKVSLRSVKTEDTTIISEEFGGGGHRNASSFVTNLEDFFRWKVSSKTQQITE